MTHDMIEERHPLQTAHVDLGPHPFLFGIGMVVLLVGLLYAPHLDAPLYHLDDLPQARIAQKAGFLSQHIFTIDYAGFLRPGVRFLWIATVGLFGFDPLPHRLFVLLLYGGICASICLLGYRWTGSRFYGLIAGLAYGLGYSHFNGVTWISAAYTELPSLFLCLVSLLLYLDGHEQGNKRKWLGSLLCYSMALLFKEGAVGWVLAMAFIDHYRFGKGTLKRIAPFAAIALTIAVIQFAIGWMGLIEGTYRDKTHHPSLLNLIGLGLAVRNLIFMPFLQSDSPFYTLPIFQSWFTILSFILAPLLLFFAYRMGPASKLSVQCLIAVLVLPALAGVKYSNSRSLVLPALFLALTVASALQWTLRKNPSQLKLLPAAFFIAYLSLNIVCIHRRVNRPTPILPQKAQQAHRLQPERSL